MAGRRKTEVRSQRADPPSSKALWRAGGRGFRTKDVLPGGGVFKRTGGAKRAKPIKTGFFAISKRTTPPSLVRFEKGIWANVYRAWHGGTL